LDRNHADTYVFAPYFFGDPLWQGGGEYGGDGASPTQPAPYPKWPSLFIDGVVRSDPSLWSANRDLVIRVMPEGQCPTRLTASAIAYSEQDLAGQPDSLWNHPEWAQLAIAPKSVDVATGVDLDPIELVVPNFGQTYKAALVVITLGNFD